MALFQATTRPEVPSPRAPIALVVLTGFLPVAAGLVSLMILDELAFVNLWALSILLIFASWFPLLLEWRRGIFDLFNLKNAFLGSFVMQNGVWMIYILITDRVAYPITDLRASNDTFTLALIYAILGVLAFHCGYYVKRQPKVAPKLPRFSENWNQWMVTLICVGMPVLGVLAFLFLMYAAGGVNEYVADWGLNRQTGLEGKWYVVVVATTLQTTPLLLAFVSALRRRSKFYLGLTLVILATITVTGLLIGFRSMVVMPILQMVVVYHYLRNPITLKPRVILAGLAVLVGLSIYAGARDMHTTTLESRLYVAADLTKDKRFWQDVLHWNLRRFQGIETLVVVMEDLERTGDFKWGRDFVVDVATAPVPRRWWPDKPTSFSLRFAAEHFGMLAPRDTGGYSPGWLGEAYMNFHVGGIIFLSFLLGLFIKVVHAYVKENRRNPSVVLLYSYLFIFVLWIVEAPTQAFVTLETYLASIIPALVVIARFARTPKRAAPTEVSLPRRLPAELMVRR